MTTSQNNEEGSRQGQKTKIGPIDHKGNKGHTNDKPGHMELWTSKKERRDRSVTKQAKNQKNGRPDRIERTTSRDEDGDESSIKEAAVIENGRAAQYKSRTG